MIWGPAYRNSARWHPQSRAKEPLWLSVLALLAILILIAFFTFVSPLTYN